MKRIYSLLVFVFALLSLRSIAQGPCTGTPGINSIVPISQTICAGTSASMSLANTYSNSGITYQWASAVISLVGPYNNINGANSNSYTTPTLGLQPSIMYYQVVITCNNSTLSIYVQCSVTIISCTNACSGAPASNTILPANHTVCVGNTANMGLANSYTGTGMTYQWGASSSQGGPYTPVTGATLSSYTSPALSTNMYYNVVITCTNSSLSYTTTHSVSVVSCTYCSGTPGSNTVLPVSHTVCAGSIATMSLANSYSTSGITYQWQSSSTSPGGPFSPITGATLSTYTTVPLNATTYYNVVITCTNSGLSISVPHAVNVVTCTGVCGGVPATTSILPLSHTVCAGNVASMSLSTTYTETGITYQWGTSPTQGGPYTPVTGATLSTYVSPTLSANMFYNVVITCTNSNLTYTTTHLVSVVSCSFCSGAPGPNTVTPLSHTVCAGDPAIMNLANSYTASGITYQWQSSTTSLSGPFTSVSGATSGSYTSPPLNSTTYYNVIITCTNSGQSINVTHVVTVVTCTACSGAPATNSILPLTYTLCSGMTATMSLANAYTVSGIIYQWQSSSSASGPFIPVTGATLSAYTTPTLANTRHYKVVITCTNSGASITPSLSVIVLNCTAVLNHQAGLSGLTVFPNPNSGEFSVESSEVSAGQLLLTDVLGREVFVSSFGGGKTIVNIAVLPVGIYYAHFKTASAVRVVKIIKE